MLYIITLLAMTVLVFIVLPIKIAMLIADHIKKNKEISNETESPSGSVECDSSTSDAPDTVIPDKAAEEREESASSSIMLLVGTVFIVLSGIAFGIAGWVNTTPLGRIGILFTAELVSFVISILFRKVFRLSGTSTAFYTVGSLFCSITFLTAGAYDMFGTWLSVDGNGRCTLAAVATLIAGVLSMLGHKLYSHKAFAYTGITSLYVALHFMVCQLTDTFEEYALAAIALQAVITAVIHLLKPQRNTALSIQITFVSDIAALLFGSASLFYMFTNSFDPTPTTIIINLIAAAELAFYGIRLHKPAMINAQAMFDICAVFQLFAYIDSNNKTEKVYCALALICIHLIHRFVPALRTRFTEDATMGVSVIAALFPVFISSFSIYPYGIPALIVTALLLSYVYSTRTSTQLPAGIVAPFLPLALASSLSYSINIKDETTAFYMTYGILALILTSAAALIFWLPSIMPEFCKRHQRVSDSVIYSSLTIAGLIMFRVYEWTPALLMFVLALPVHYFISSKQRNNICTVFPLISASLMVYSWLGSIDAESTMTGSVVMTIVFLAYAAASKLFYRSGIKTNAGGNVRIDTPVIAAAIPMLLTLTQSEHSGFFFFVVIAVYITCFIKSRTSKKTAATTYSVSAVLMTVGFLNRPFFVSESESFTIKVDLALIALLGAAFRYIWREYPEKARKLSDFVWRLAFIGLIADAFYFQTAGNTIFVLAVIGTIMVFSYLGKNKSWFMCSALSILLITLYSTRKYLMALDWWVYLFIAGIVLITIAAINEYYKNKGESLKGKFTKNFEGWSR